MEIKEQKQNCPGRGGLTTVVHDRGSLMILEYSDRSRGSP